MAASEVPPVAIMGSRRMARWAAEVLIGVVVSVGALVFVVVVVAGIF
jgi:hypothetical protein